MRACTRCRQLKPDHALYRIHGGDHHRVYYCARCRERWLESEGRAAVSLEHRQGAEPALEDAWPCDGCGVPTPRPRRSRCPACYMRLLRAEGKVAS